MCICSAVKMFLHNWSVNLNQALFALNGGYAKFNGASEIEYFLRNKYATFRDRGVGFIGSAFVRLAPETIPNCSIVNFDALTYAGNPDNLEGLDSSRHQLVHANICDRDAVMNALGEDVDAIVNFAAESHVDRSIADAAEFSHQYHRHTGVA